LFVSTEELLSVFVEVEPNVIIVDDKRFAHLLQAAGLVAIARATP
jgi:hypothetical protein